jgi:hypothetical protein
MEMEESCAPEMSVFTCKTSMCHNPGNHTLKHINWLLWVITGYVIGQ